MQISGRTLAVLALVVLALLQSACANRRNEYSDARAAKTRYRECLEQNPVDPEVCDALRSEASDAYGDYKRRGRTQRGCEADPSLCR